MERRRRRSPGLCLVAGAAAVAAMAISASLILQPEPGLLDHASRLADARSWLSGFGGYFWENGHSVLTFRKQQIGVAAISVDISTGAETQHAALSSDLRQGVPDQLQRRLSPDGRCLLWPRLDRTSLTWCASDLNGTRLKNWVMARQPTGAVGPLWLSDGRTWVEIRDATNYSGTYAVLYVCHSLNSSDRSSKSISGLPVWTVGVAPDNGVVALQWLTGGSSGGDRIAWSEYKPFPKPGGIVTKTVPMPEAATGLDEAELSPRGDRIACLVHYTYLSPLEKLLQRFFAVRIQPHEKVGLWVIRRDGGGKRLVGSEDGGSPFGLLWTQDGRRLSFVDHDSLYSVSAGLN